VTTVDYEMSTEEIKDWILRQDLPLSRDLIPAPDRLKLELEDLGFEAIKLRQVGPHPVWSFAGRIGGSTLEHDFIIAVALKKIALKMGFKAKNREIVVEVFGGRFSGAICLDPGVACN
jgi:hypothetical protein